MLRKRKRFHLATVYLGIGFGLAGCNVDGRWTQYRGPTGGMEATATANADRGGGIDISIVEPREVDLVEILLTHREAYRRTLQQLHDYYVAHGYLHKSRWAAFELKGLRNVKQFRYLMDAEIASDALRPTEQIPEADVLYEQGRDLMRGGGHGVPGLYREDRMIQAADLLRRMIEQYPSSDKIDDAAFFLGEIHKEYLPNQDQIAVKWYERAWTWNPNTPHPARFQAAVVYDFRLHDRDRALELYQGVIEHEASIEPSNVRWAIGRISDLTGGDRTPQASQP